MTEERNSIATGRSTVVGVLTTMFLLAATLLILLGVALTDWSGDFGDDDPSDSNLAAPTAESAADSRQVRPIGSVNPGDWITSDDYPPQALRQGIEGRVSFMLDMDAAGRPIRCTITNSSGSSLLDDATCHAMMRSARLPPKIGDEGIAIPFHFTRSVVWKIPQE